ncbi:hypothetical protein GEMRC1_010411 [Eukaryota sp. GEM-RC1]
MVNFTERLFLFIDKTFRKGDRPDNSPSHKILLLGLGNAGKTRLLYHYFGEERDIVPTIGFNLEEIRYNKQKFTMQDLGSGRRSSRDLWKCYYQDTRAIFLVIDALDRHRLRCSTNDCGDCAYCVHQQIVQETDSLIPKPRICFLLNKCNGDDPISTETLIETLELPPDSPVFQVSAVTGQGVYEPLEWVLDNVL